MQEIVLAEKGKTSRPFLEASKIIPRSCSLPLQRRIVDFGADVPFRDVPKKLLEHYGMEVCPEIIRKTTLGHAEKMGSIKTDQKDRVQQTGVMQLIAEADGGMIPIVIMNDHAEDKRKTRKVLWKEARLCFCRDYKKIGAVFKATLKSTEVLGDLWFTSALEAGMGNQTKIHCIGDGALWIKEQADRIFGGKNTYLTDFYHVSEYLAKVSNDYSKEPDKWLEEQQIHLKEGRLYRVLQELEKYVYGKEEPKESAQACYRYLTNRMLQLDYLGAILEKLPIGSGEIESAHRHVVQKRMKRAGSWWKEENAEKMLQLLTLRANGLWGHYWANVQNGFTEQAA